MRSAVSELVPLQLCHVCVVDTVISFVWLLFTTVPQLLDPHKCFLIAARRDALQIAEELSNGLSEPKLIQLRRVEWFLEEMKMMRSCEYGVVALYPPSMKKVQFLLEGRAFEDEGLEVSPSR